MQAAVERAISRSEATKREEAQDRSDAEKEEASRRDTMLRIAAGAFSNVIALANEAFVAELHKRLADELFYTDLRQLMRLHCSGMSNDPISYIRAGAQALIGLVRKLSGAQSPPMAQARRRPILRRPTNKATTS